MSKIAVEFTKDELKQLLEDSNSCVSLKRDVYSLALYPYHLADFSSSVKSILNGRIARFEKKLGGILLGYRNIKLQSSDGTIVTDSCHVHVDIEADFYIFKPEVGSSLKGEVNKKSGDHVGCLVHKLFNISIPKQDQGDDWIGYLVEIGQEVVVNVTHIDLHSRLPYIRADFDIENYQQSESSRNEKHSYFNEDNEEELISTPVSKKKKNKSNINDLINSYEENDEHTKEKKKKRKSKDLEVNFDELNKTNEESSKEKKKKEKRKSKEIVEEENVQKQKKNKELNSNKVEKHHKNDENTKIKKRKHSLENTNKEMEGSPKKKHKNIKEENISTPNKLDKESKDSTKHKKHSKDSEKKKNKLNGTLSWENIVSNLHDSDLEKSFKDSVSKEKKKNKESLNKSTEESHSKKRKREETLSDEEIPVKKHKSKKKKRSMDAENLT